MLKKQFKKIFNLEGYVLDEVKEKKDKIYLYCHLQKQTMRYRSERSKKVNTTQKRVISHSVFENKKVYIVINQRKFYFSKYNQRLWESLPQVKRGSQVTQTFKKTPFNFSETPTTAV